jgi:phosphoribosylformylglycinamidine synthase subunit PurQ / glutaminase
MKCLKNGETDLSSEERNRNKNKRALVVTGSGINCEEEMAAACRLAGAEADIVHLSRIFNGDVSIHDYDLLNLPGGFSFGDDLGSAKVLANLLKVRSVASGPPFMEEIQRFLEDGKYIIGVCNGFQALVKMGLLPNTGGNCEQEATLTFNDSGKFEDRWVTCKVLEDNPTPFLKGIDYIDLTVRHGEGKLIFRDEKVRLAVTEQKMNVLAYADKEKHITDKYPYNPNGSELNCAGLCDPSGQVFGLMPHPEAYLAVYNHPDWNRRKKTGQLNDETGEGLQIFVNVVGRVTRFE